MGCKKSKEIETSKEQVFSWDRADRPDPKDFTIANINDSVCGRLPGTVNGQQFVIQKCTNSSIYIFDFSAMVTIDDCENCKFFIGPVKGSIFLRNCKNCQCIIACQQYRARDCRKIDAFLLCASQPIIESCSSMRFGCFSFFYPELQVQFKNAGLSVFNNNWSSVYDFTPVQDGNCNWSFLPENLSVETLVPKPNNEAFSNIDIRTDHKLSIVPFSRGKLDKRYDDSCLLVFFAKVKNDCKLLLENLHQKASFDLIQSKEIKINPDDASRIFRDEKYCKLVDQGPLIGLELNGDNIIQQVESVLKRMSISLNDVYLTTDQRFAKKDIDAFYNFVDMTMT
ncbi:protein XRP2 [Hydra vulgaris]|uniref:Protein XRP2 n=1 Tax=Hydra vulgaris TaxID=6087 RepID=T2MI24_HYDVU|nr:protein XRP2 [Hydra vulgaris]XP_047140147.1 protein XRP2 [Hydra vulgaris]XP_047140148.1 protein XRP2 [Hydra vulgaris]XP_047140149.1 protein XRP2 [Hydra vulgaris]